MLFFILGFIFIFTPIWENMSYAHLTEFSECMRCHGGPDSLPAGHVPRLPDKFSANWTMYEYSGRHKPPMEAPPEYSRKIYGTTYFDSNAKGFTEIYKTKCIDIFPGEARYPCQFLSLNSRTWLIRFESNSLKKVISCDRWPVKTFYGPQPDFLKHFPKRNSVIFRGFPAQTWFLDIPLPGPFGYLTRETEEFHPVSFWVPVLSGWAQQDFYNFRLGHIPEGAFRLPKICPKEQG